MRLIRLFVFLIGIATSASILPAQDQKPANESAAPPALLLLVHQQAYPGKSAEREKLIAAESRISDRLDSAYYWIDLESITGDPESLLCFPFDSYNHMQQSNEEWKQLLTAHPEIDRMRGELESLIGSQRGIIAMRRDDLGYHADSIDLSEARYVNVLEVRLFPGRESDFADASKILVEAFDKIHAETAWVVYQVDAGTPSPTFLVFRPVAELKQNDEFLSYDADLAEAEGEQSVEALQRISRESYASTVKDIYAVHPQLSHVSKSFAAGDVDFWFHSPAPAPKPEAKADSKSSGKP